MAMKFWEGVFNPSFFYIKTCIYQNIVVPLQQKQEHKSNLKIKHYEKGYYIVRH